YYMLLTVILGLLLSAFYWIPAIFEMKYTNILSQIGGGADFRDHFVCINQFWQSQWGFGGSAPGCIDGLSFMIGKSHLLISLLGLLGLIWLLLKSKAEINKYRSETSIAVFTTIGMISAIFLMLEISKFIWESIPLMAFFQYPWRFLLLASFFSSVFAGFFIWFLKNRIKNAGSFLAILAVVIISLIYFNVKFFDSQVVEFKTDKDYTNLNTLRWKISKISDEYMPKYFNKPRNENNVPNKIIEINENQGKILFKSENSKTLQYFFDILRQTELKLNLAYFPAWQFYIDGKKVTPKILNNGISLSIKTGRHELYAEFVQTPLEKFANTLSLSGLFILIIGIIFSNRIVIYERKNI
ncbi:MAG: hypothetical protein QXO70_03140, partial [Candidatus Pacearchaeota archaeon]